MNEAYRPSLSPMKEVLVRPYVPHLPAISEVLMGESGDWFKKSFVLEKLSHDHWCLKSTQVLNT